MDFKQFYDIERYLFNTVRQRFIKESYLTAFDFFCIVIWKVERYKSKLTKKLLAQGYETLDAAVKELTKGIAIRREPEDKLRYLLEEWKLPLGTTTAILTVFYPQYFTVYDTRVCGVISDAKLGDFHNLNQIGRFEDIWAGYQEFKEAVQKITPNNLSLRDKDRYLWGKSFYEQLKKDIANKFNL